MLVHRDGQFNYVQTVDKHTFGRGGYSNFECTINVAGGFAGATCDLAIASSYAARRMKLGHLIEWWVDGRPVYVGQLKTDPDNRGDSWGLVMDGVVNRWCERTVADIGYLANTASVVIADQVAIYGPGALLSTSTSWIGSTSYGYAAKNFDKQQHVGDIINAYDEGEGYEWGGFIPAPGRSMNEKTAFFYRAPDLKTVHYVLDARWLAEEPRLQQDEKKWGNRIRVDYNGGYVTVNGTQQSRDEHTDTWAPRANISNTSSSSTDAQRVGETILAGFKVDGIEQPPVSMDLVLDFRTARRGLNALAAQRHLMWMPPGCNMLIAGTANLPRTLAATDSKVFLHVPEMQISESQVRLKARRYFDPAAILARAAA